MMICYSHSKGDVEKTIAVFKLAFEVVRDAISSGKVADWLEGDVVETIIREPQRANKLT